MQIRALTDFLGNFTDHRVVTPKYLFFYIVNLFLNNYVLKTYITTLCLQIDELTNFRWDAFHFVAADI